MKNGLKYAAIFAITFALPAFALVTNLNSANERLTAELDQRTIELHECERSAKPRLLGLNSLNADLIATLGDTTLADLFTAVAVREAGWGLNSVNARAYNNLFGMRYAGQRYALAQTAGGYAIYESRQDCLQDLREWVYERGGGQPALEQDLYEWLAQRGYCPNCEGYYEGLREIQSLIQSY